ncbi:MAG TPA: hypothetical protein PK339_03760 [Flavitalea sp.]|nr:hypothetical protein [Flavitalea sp.]
MSKQIKKNIFIAACLALSGVVAFSQDSAKRRTIDITSTFKPVLREAAKINFNAAPPTADTTRPVLNYNIPAENLFFTYQPANLKPLALEMDSLSGWDYSNFIKVGLGNVHLPYIKAGFSFGDGENTFFNLFASHYSSKGKLDFQKNSQTKVGATATYKTFNQHEWNFGLGFTSDDYFLYGFKPDSLPFTKDQLRQRFQTIEGRADFRNTVPSSFGLTYRPSVRASIFSDNHNPRVTEANSVVNLPVQKELGRTAALNLALNADLTNYRNNDGSGKKTQNNNVFTISPSVIIKSSTLFLQAGVIPSWDNGEFHLLPNAMADITTNDQRFTLQLGWIGYYNKGSYQRFASINPWLARPDSLLNTRVQEGYVGFKGSMGDHFSYSAKVGYQLHKNIPLFVNDTVDGKTFAVIYEPKLNILQMHAEAEYRVGEKFSAKGIFNLNNFIKIEQEAKAWGMIPLELGASLRWQVLNDLWFRSELWTWNAPGYRTKNGEAFKGDGAFDLNVGAEFRVAKGFNIWFQMNNILNNKYERWNQYEVYGFQVLGGIVYSFNQK